MSSRISTPKAFVPGKGKLEITVGVIHWNSTDDSSALAVICEEIWTCGAELRLVRRIGGWRS